MAVRDSDSRAVGQGIGLERGRMLDALHGGDRFSRQHAMRLRHGEFIPGKSSCGGRHAR